MSNYSMLIETEGYGDLCSPETKDLTVWEATADSPTHTFDEVTQQFTETAVSPTHKVRSASTKVYTSGSEYVSSLETVNMLHIKEEIEDKTIKMALQTTPSKAHIQLRYSSDGNYDFITAVKEFAQGQDNETASFGNDTIRYRGTKQAVINETKIGQRVSHSIKFKITVMPDVEDDVNIVSLTALTSGLIFDGETNG